MYVAGGGKVYDHSVCATVKLMIYVALNYNS